MSLTNASKRIRIETSLVKLPKTYNRFTITINSDKFLDSNHSPVHFKYSMEREGDYFKNGHLNLTAGPIWKCCLSRLDAPDNVITFPSLSPVGNLNAAYFVLSFETKTKRIDLPFNIYNI